MKTIHTHIPESFEKNKLSDAIQGVNKINTVADLFKTQLNNILVNPEKVKKEQEVAITNELAEIFSGKKLISKDKVRKLQTEGKKELAMVA